MKEIKPIKKDFHPHGKPYLGKGTNGQKKDVWIILGTSNWQKLDKGASWTECGYEFEHKLDAYKFYRDCTND